MVDGYRSMVENPSPMRNATNHMMLGFLAGISTVMLVAAILFCLFGTKLIALFKQHRTLKGKEYNSFKDETMPLRRFTFDEIERATKNFSQEFLLGSGAFGNVYKGNFELEGTLAIKRAHGESFLSVDEFRNVRLLATVKHRNLIGLVGYCEEPERFGARILVYECVPNGSLLEYMIGNKNSLTWKQRVNIAIGAARGIAYLHEGIKPSIIHRDLKPSNILLGEGFEAKVSDFGLVKSGPIEDQSHVSSQIKGTPGYLDPAYCSSFHLTKFTDVYSFGVILLQLVSARPAVDTNEVQSKQHIIDWASPSLEKGNVEEIIDANLLCQSEPCNMRVMLKMGQLALRCVVQEPKSRPTMIQVCQELEQALYSEDTFNNKQHSSKGFPSIGLSQQSSVEKNDSFVSIDGVGLQKFHIDMDSLSFQSTRLMCLENNSISIDIDNNNLKRIQEDGDI
ncbi:probable serine/threonine-protein kinase PBL1 isoform X2 [Arachis duranensis]|uniref:non-specific serine/threonine protein kinase n=1 Tax=Arachis duranensis TaxID=130453 RepID=A0A9C6WLF4_ARADU|nr:probable serine/threonine-protein kinase PBL1 isoform X2 [Arachis duranensis]XP_052112194.1 probable serine/threonine-protein kinase PBL1 isoform X2 [Arachis duranensis]